MKKFNDAQVRAQFPLNVEPVPNPFRVARECTCVECDNKHTCEFAFDPYNMDGDCLLDK